MTVQPKSVTKELASARPCCAWKLLAAILLLRLCVGWHFFSEGIQKVAYDRNTGQWGLDFSAEGFFRQAKGPLAKVFWERIPGGHHWQANLIVPRQLTPSGGEQLSDWVTEYVRRRQSELKSGKHADVEILDFVPFASWKEQIDLDRRAMLKGFIDVPGLTEAQRTQAAEAFERRDQQLADYLAGESLDIQAYQHELWRLDNMQQAAGAEEVPYRQSRIAKKAAEVDSTPQKWVATVRQYDQEFVHELQGLLTEEQAVSVVGAQANAALTDPKKTQLRWVNLAVTGLTIGVGCCLLLGLFTRLASVVGALFLLSVMVTQLPWVPGANTVFFYYQLVEFAALLFLAAVAAGRVAGLDFILHGLWWKCCGSRGA